MCEVKDLKGNRCPENSRHKVVVDYLTFYLCDRCYINYLNGAYNPPTSYNKKLSEMKESDFK